MFSFSDPEVCLFQTISKDNFIKHSFEFHDKVVKKVRFSDENMSKEINQIEESMSEILDFSENELQLTPKSSKESAPGFLMDSTPFNESTREAENDSISTPDRTNLTPEFQSTPVIQKLSTPQIHKVPIILVDEEEEEISFNFKTEIPTPALQNDLSTPEIHNLSTPLIQKVPIVFIDEEEEEISFNFKTEVPTPVIQKELELHPDFQMESTPEFLKMVVMPENGKKLTPEFQTEEEEISFNTETPALQNDSALKTDVQLGLTPERQEVSTLELEKLPTLELEKLSTAELEKLPTHELEKLSTPVLETVSTTELEKLSTPELEKLSTPGLEKLSTPQLEALSTTEFEMSSSTEFEMLSSTEFEMLSSTEFEKLSIPELEKLLTIEEKLLTNEIENLPTPEHEKVSKPELENLSTSELEKLSIPDLEKILEKLSTPENGHEDSSLNLVSLFMFI